MCLTLYLGMQKIIFIIFLVFGFNSFAQVKADRTSYDFGDIYPNARSYIDIVFTNNTDKKQFLLNVDKPRDVYYIFSSKTLLPDSAITIRLKVNDALKGKFNHTIQIYFSDSNDAIPIQLKGNVKEASSNPLMACPDFNSTPPSIQNSTDFALTIKVIDSLTFQPIHRAKVTLIRNNRQVGVFTTNRDGIIHEEVPIGLYLIASHKPDYYDNFKEAYVNFQRNYIEVKLQQPYQEIIVEVEEEVIAEVPEIEDVIEEEEEEDVIEIEIVEEPEVPETEVEEPVSEEVVETEVEIPYVDTTALEDLPDSLFDLGHFKLNNITFILDVSSSMNAVGKLDLLKLSMTELANVLREDDLITILKYSSTVDVVIDGMRGNQREEIISSVAELKTSSSTAGGDAIEEAYRMNRQVYDPNRNNIVIMITDGAFNSGSKNYLETIASHYDKKGIIFSVVGIKTSTYITSHMENIVEKGGGDFIQVRTVEDAETKIIKEIKRTSFRGR